MFLKVAFLLSLSIAACQSLGGPPLTYIHLRLVSSFSNKSRHVCANLQLFDKTSHADQIAEILKKKLQLMAPLQDSEICKTVNLTGSAVYKNDNATRSRFCPKSYYTNISEALMFLQSQQASSILMRQKRLHATFQSPSLNINESFMQVPYIYVRSDFMDVVEDLNGRWPFLDDVTIDIMSYSNQRGYVPLLLMLLVALISIAIGGIWSGHKTMELLRTQTSSKQAGSEEHDRSGEVEKQQQKLDHADRPLTYCGLCIMMSMIVILLMSLYYFYDYLVWFIIIMFVYATTISFYTCLSALWNRSFGEECCKTPEFRLGHFVSTYILCCCKNATENLKQVLCSPKNLIIFTISFTIGILWFIYRKHPYSFIWHDLIAIVFSIYLISNLRIHSLKWITLLFSLMFVYDLFMVFISPLFMSGGCSIMVEAVTGGGCSKGPKYDYPDPSNVTIPVGDSKEQVPVMFRMMDFTNPLLDCFNSSIDKVYPSMALGLGDVIVPGLLIGYNHAWDLAWGHRRHPYYIVGVIGYIIGLIMAFWALELMSQAQPALIYLVPCTLLPTYVVALVYGEFEAMWKGELIKRPVVKSPSKQSLSEPSSQQTTTTP